jgi:predicted LPLAT superfamily acyltransferase
VADWRKIPEAGTVAGIRLLVWITRLFGRRVVGWVLYIVAFYYALLRPSVRRASREYLTKVGQPARFRDVVRHVHVFARVSLDRLFFVTGKVTPFTFEQKNHDQIVKVATERKGVLLIGAHVGSFEAMRARAREFKVPINVVVDFSNAEKINGVLRSLSADLETKLIALGEDPLAAMLEIKAAIDRGELVAILGDRAPAPDALPRAKTSAPRAVDSEFLGAPATFPAGPWLIAHALKCPVYFVAGLFTPPNHYALQFELLADEVRLDRKDRAASLSRYARTYAEVLENHVRAAPLNWFNFYDFWTRK